MHDESPLLEDGDPEAETGRSTLLRTLTSFAHCRRCAPLHFPSAPLSAAAFPLLERMAVRMCTSICMPQASNVPAFAKGSKSGAYDQGYGMSHSPA
jgi:hypothetical protein